MTGRRFTSVTGAVSGIQEKKKMIKVHTHYPSMGGTRIELKIDGKDASIYLLPDNTIEFITSAPCDIEVKKTASNAAEIKLVNWIKE